MGEWTGRENPQRSTRKGSEQSTVAIIPTPQRMRHLDLFVFVEAIFELLSSLSKTLTLVSLSFGFVK